jgi:hypothetical protein
LGALSSCFPRGLERVRKEAADPAIGARRAAARMRGAQERLDRLEAALEQIPEVTSRGSDMGQSPKSARNAQDDAHFLRFRKSVVVHPILPSCNGLDSSSS